MAKRFFNARWFSAFGMPQSAVEYLRILDSDLASTEEGGIDHNSLQGLQGGDEGERNHLTDSQVSGLHSRSHAVTSTEDHTAGSWKVFYSNGDGEVIELALDSDGKVLTSNGIDDAPTFEDVPIPDHEDLGNLQGGVAGQYYHILEPQAAIPDAEGSDEVDRINDILAVLRVHGLIET